MKTNRFWILVLGIITVISLITMLLFMRTSADIAKIYLDGELIESIDLRTVREPYEIKTVFEGGINTVEIEQGRIRVISANCPDGSCVRQGWNSGSLSPIVCLPNRLVITVEGSRDIDAIIG